MRDGGTGAHVASNERDAFATVHRDDRRRACFALLFAGLLYFLYISFVYISCGIHALSNLVQIVPDFSKRRIVFLQFGIVNVKDIAIQN